MSTSVQLRLGTPYLGESSSLIPGHTARSNNPTSEPSPDNVHRFRTSIGVIVTRPLSSDETIGRACVGSSASTRRHEPARVRSSSRTRTASNARKRRSVRMSARCASSTTRRVSRIWSACNIPSNWPPAVIAATSLDRSCSTVAGSRSTTAIRSLGSSPCRTPRSHDQTGRLASPTFLHRRIADTPIRNLASRARLHHEHLRQLLRRGVQVVALWRVLHGDVTARFLRGMTYFAVHSGRRQASSSSGQHLLGRSRVQHELDLIERDGL